MTSSNPRTTDAELADEVQTLERAAAARTALTEAVAARVVGQEAVIELMLIALLSRSHALLVGVPGLAKTLLVASLAEAMDLQFGRVQFTPDLLPSDITGADVLVEAAAEGGHGVSRSIRFQPGPLFANLVLADEINRTPPKTQAALLQAMQERHVTVGAKTHALPSPFLVFATRNPIEQEGTYPLPEAQLDRFLLEVHVDYPSADAEREIARRTTSADPGRVPRVLSTAQVAELQQLVPRLPVTGEALDLAVALARATRPKASGGDGVVKAVEEYVRFGAGPRGSQALVLAAKARAALHGSPVARAEDVRALAVPVLRHRLVLGYRAEAERVRDVDVIEQVVAQLTR